MSQFLTIGLTIICTLIYLGFLFYLSVYWEKAFRGKFPRSKYIIRAAIIILGALPLISTVNFIWHPDIPNIEALAFGGFIVSALFLYIAMFMVITHFLVLFFTKVLHKGKWCQRTLGRMCLIASEIIFSLLFCIFGVWGANHLSVSEIDIGSGPTALKVVALSDIHYGTPGSTVNLDKMATQINAQNPDLVLIAGDVFDYNTNNRSNEEFAAAMQKIKATYGVYAINGNHEYYENNHQDIERYYRHTGVNLLVDEAVEIDGLLRVAGRDDLGYISNTQKSRQPLEAILAQSDQELPLIVLDHQPQDYREAKDNGALLQISGHTHNGQIWPGDILVRMIYKIAYNCPSDGIHSSDGFSLAITRGYGTWGFPMRSTGSSQILCFNLGESVFNR